MPHGVSWFDYIFSTMGEWRTRLQELIGTSYIDHADISVQYIIGFAFIGVLLLALALIARRKFSVARGLIPDDRLNWRTFFEMMIEGAFATMEGIMGRKAARFFLPLITSCMFIILFSNCFGLIPGFTPPTGNLNMTLAMALVIFFTTHIWGIKEHGVIKYFAEWCGPFRKWWAFPFMLFFFAIEAVSHVARPASLSIRLMGNMFADHAVVASFTLLCPIIVPVPVLLLGVLVCIVQTAVFCILSTVYIGMAVAHEEH
jgi:F-type H+-transporting ATPase subunit a